MNCPKITTMVSRYSCTSAGRLNKDGRLFKEPARLLVQTGSEKKIMTQTNTAAIPTMKKDPCQPTCCPRWVPIGTPSTVATIEPPITAAKPKACFPKGATLAASGVMMDQKMECVTATQTRAPMSFSNVSAHKTTK